MLSTVVVTTALLVPVAPGAASSSAAPGGDVPARLSVGPAGGAGPLQLTAAVTPTTWERQVIVLTNRARSRSRSCGRYGVKPPAPPLRASGALTAAARRHARDMAVHHYFSHSSRDGRDPGDRMWAAGYRWSWWGENIAAGQPTPAAVVRDWLASDGHCANLMQRRFRHIGVGLARVATSPYGTYWVQDFGRPR